MAVSQCILANGTNFINPCQAGFMFFCDFQSITVAN
jgi:hypothetical protein